MFNWLFPLLGFSDARPGVERLTLLVSLILMVVVPPLVVEFYPFSIFPMFSDAPLTRVRTTARDGKGVDVSLSAFGILDTYVAHPAPLLNVVPQRPNSAAYRFWTDTEFVPLVQSTLAQREIEGPITVTQELLGSQVQNGRPSVGVVSRKTWIITSSAYEVIAQ